MRRIAVLSLFLCLVAVCRAQYIGSQYMNVKLGYIVDESQVQGTFGFGKVYKAFKVGANLNYRNRSWGSQPGRSATRKPRRKAILCTWRKARLSCMDTRSG